MHYYYHLSPKLVYNKQTYHFPVERRAHFCSSALSAKPQIHESSVLPTETKVSNKSKKKARRESPEAVLRLKLDACSKHGDVIEALRLYDEERINGT